MRSRASERIARLEACRSIVSGGSRTRPIVLLNLRHGPARSPWLVCTASNDRYLRIWDVRQLSSLKTEPYTLIDSAPDADLKESDRKAMSTAAAGRAFPQDECSYETLQAAQTSKKKGAARGILRGQSLHGKSCSSAYWDPWGQRILTTSYDDRLRSKGLWVGAYVVGD